MMRPDRIDLRSPTNLEFDGAELRVESGSVTLVAKSGELTLDVPALVGSEFAAFWSNGPRLVLVGLNAREAVLAESEPPNLTKIGPLERLDLSDAYDPGGLEWVSFLEIPPSHLLIILALAAAMIDLEKRSLVWQRVHDDIEAAFVAIRDNASWFDGRDGAFGLDLDDGHFRVE